MMTSAAGHDALAIAHEFTLVGDILAATPYGSGHINDTYKVDVQSERGPSRYVLQRINHKVFLRPDELMSNVERVCAHAFTKLQQAGTPDAERRTLRLIPTRHSKAWHIDPAGNRWRCYHFIEGATGHDVVRSAEQAHAAAKSFGAFQALLADLPGGRLHETIPDFHHTPSRFARFQQALAQDAHGRAAACVPEIAFALARAHEVSVVVDALRDGTLPERVTHNDTKLNNVLLDNITQEGVCVIDLDTVMPGSVLYDFGDLVRTSTSPAAEDEPDLAKVRMQFPMFEALVKGYLETTRGFLTSKEKELLPFAGKLITFEIGLRFLTDWLEGDTYFKIKRPTHNLDRARTQFKLVESIEAQLPAMQALVACT
jgi:Ser/Thr protein kinase RdoA (MazF antagonist)